MSNRICGKCGSHKVADAGSYGGSAFFKCETCGQMGMLEKFPEMTFFDCITSSREELAEEMVFCIQDHLGYWWTSNILNDYYNTRDDVIAATVEKLKEKAE